MKINWEFIEANDDNAIPQDKWLEVEKFLLSENFKEEICNQDNLSYYKYDYSLIIGFNEIGVIYINKEKKLFFIRWY